MSKKKILGLICLVIVTSWVLVSLYYYNKHVVTVQEYKVGERIETPEGIVIIHSIEIHDFEQRPFYFKQREWLYNSLLPKIPVKLHIPVMRALAFYSERYNFDLGIDDREGRIMYLYGIYVYNEENGGFYDDSMRISATAAVENGFNLTARGSGFQRDNSSNIVLFHSRGNFYFNEYSPDSDDKLIIKVKDTLNNEIYERIVEPAWETKKYNFFTRPATNIYSFSPDEAVNKFIRAVVYEKDISMAEGFIHPLISDFPWERFDHDGWSRTQGRTTQYIGSYLGFEDVFTTLITYGGFDESADILEQRIALVNYHGEWKIIDVGPLTTIHGS